MQYFTGDQINTATITGSATFSGNSKNRGNVRFAYFTENSSHESGNFERAIFNGSSFFDLTTQSVMGYAEFNDNSEYRTTDSTKFGNYAPDIVYFKGSSKNKGYINNTKTIFQDTSVNYGVIDGPGSKAFHGLSENYGFASLVYFRDQSKNYAKRTVLDSFLIAVHTQ